MDNELARQIPLRVCDIIPQMPDLKDAYKGDARKKDSSQFGLCYWERLDRRSTSSLVIAGDPPGGGDQGTVPNDRVKKRECQENCGPPLSEHWNTEAMQDEINKGTRRTGEFCHFNLGSSPRLEMLSARLQVT